jgi:hypothetical protein
LILPSGSAGSNKPVPSNQAAFGRLGRFRAASPGLSRVSVRIPIAGGASA